MNSNHAMMRSIPTTVIWSVGPARSPARPRFAERPCVRYAIWPGLAASRSRLCVAPALGKNVAPYILHARDMLTSRVNCDCHGQT